MTFTFVHWTLLLSTAWSGHKVHLASHLQIVQALCNRSMITLNFAFVFKLGKSDTIPEVQGSIKYQERKSYKSENQKSIIHESSSNNFKQKTQTVVYGVLREFRVKFSSPSRRICHFGWCREAFFRKLLHHGEETGFVYY